MMNEPTSFTTRITPDLRMDQGVAADSVTETIFEARHEGQAKSTVRENAISALHFLLAQSGKPAVLIARDWRLAGVPYIFEHLQQYQEVAATSECFMVSTEREQHRGVEHLIFMTWVKDLTQEQLLDCIDLSPNDHPIENSAEVHVTP